MSAALQILGERPGSQQDGTYPRPQLVRASWVGLDRQVGFAHDDAMVGLAERWYTTADPFTRQIQLPFAPESDASGIGDKAFHPCVWYRIELTDADLTDADFSNADLTDSDFSGARNMPAQLQEQLGK